MRAFCWLLKSPAKVEDYKPAQQRAETTSAKHFHIGKTEVLITKQQLTESRILLFFWILRRTLSEVF